MHIEQNLYKIIRGHFRLCVDGLVLLFTEPSSKLIADSYEIYDAAYDAAYEQGSYVDLDLQKLLMEQNIWTPFHEKELEKKRTNLENAKLSAFENFIHSKVLAGIKMEVWVIEQQIESLLFSKHRMDHLSCSSVAEMARFSWLLSQCINPPNSCDSQKLSEAYKEKIIDYKEIRAISRSDIWRSIWNASKKTYSLFDKPAIDLTRDQISLISYSTMYDNVYEHPESPSDKVIEDDICLDGWFILQKRKSEKDKKASEVDSMMRNPKIKNAGEVFVMAQSKEDAESIFDLNDMFARQKIQQRAAVINDKKSVKDMQFADVMQDIEIRKNNMTRDHLQKRK